MKRAWTIILALGAGFSVVSQAAPISRCEYADGRVIYSDEACPAGSQRTRTVNEKPAVEVIKSSAEKRSAQDAKSSGSVRRSGEADASSSTKDPDAASDQRKAKVAECDDLVRKVEYAQHDLASASESERASAELTLRRLQAEHESRCAPKR